MSVRQYSPKRTAPDIIGGSSKIIEQVSDHFKIVS